MFGSFLIWGARERPFSSGLSAWELTPPIPQPQMRRIGVKIYTKVYLIVWFFYRSVTSIAYQYNMTETHTTEVPNGQEILVWNPRVYQDSKDGHSGGHFLWTILESIMC